MKRINLHPRQAEILLELATEQKITQKRFNEALELVGIDPTKIREATLVGNEPHILIEDELPESIVK